MQMIRLMTTLTKESECADQSSSFFFFVLFFADQSDILSSIRSPPLTRTNPATICCKPGSKTGKFKVKPRPNQISPNHVEHGGGDAEVPRVTNSATKSPDQDSRT